jgi:4-amino-4-deoxy-L-arabinose transferase-like glycosyltransferase
MTKKELICLFLILILTGFFRFWKLNEIPPGLYPDVAINGNEAFFSLKNKDFKVFYPENYGREGLMIWLIALSFKIFGVSVLSIRMVAATIGVLTVLGLYLLTKELFRQSPIYNLQSAIKIALFSSFFLAVSFWHTNLSRIGFRAILLPFVLVFSFYFLFKAFRKKSVFDAMLAGIFFGLGFYTYTSFRMAVLILPFIFIPLWFVYKREGLQKKFLLLTSCFLLLTFFVALPIGIYFLKNPQDFISRTAPVSIFKAENPEKEFFKSLILHLGMFNFYGDPNWRHNFSGKPMLFWPVGILFLLGFSLAIKEIIVSIKNKSLFLPPSYFLLLSWFFIMLLPGILTREGVPHSLRVVGVIPPVFIFSGLGAFWVYQFLEKKFKNKLILNALVLFFLFFVLTSEFNKYFFVWAEKPEVKSEFNQEYLAMGNYLNSLPEDFGKYVIVNRGGVPVSWANNIPMPAQTIMFLEISKYGEIKSNYLLPEDIERIKIEKSGVFLPLICDLGLIERLKILFPEGKIKETKDFCVYEIEK